MNRVLFPAGVSAYPADLTATETYRSEETLRRWNDIVESPGVIAKRVTDDVLLPATGATGVISISAGEAYVRSGEYVYSSGGTITGLTSADMFPSGNTYVAVSAVDTTGNTRTHITSGDELPTRAWNASGGTVFSLVNSRTGSTFVVLAQVTSITTGGTVTLDTSVRDLFRLGSTAKPSTPGTISYTTGLVDRDLTLSSGVTRATRESSNAYVRVELPAVTHNDGIHAYRVDLQMLTASDTTVSGATLTQLLYIGGDISLATGVTFTGLTQGVRAKIHVYALSNSLIPIQSLKSSTSAFTVGGVAQLTMPTVSVTHHSWGIELTWPLTGATSGLTRFEVFAGSSSSITGSTVDYANLMWAGPGGKAMVPADIGDTIYVKVRGMDGGGQVTSDYETMMVDFTGLTALPAPQNVRVKQVRAQRLLVAECSEGYQTSKFSTAIKGGLVTDKAIVQWAWNWDDIEGTGGNGTFTATNLSGITADQLISMQLWLPTTAQSYVIYDNNASSGNSTLLYVRNIDGSAVNLTGESIDGASPAAIHCGGDGYNLLFQRFEDDAGSPGGELPDRRERLTTRFRSPLTDQQAVEVVMPLGAFQRLSVYAVEEDKVVPPSTSTTSSTQRIEFEDLADWESTGTTVSVVATDYGMQLTVSTPSSVLSDISGFAYGYVPVNEASAVDFSNSAHNVQTTDGVRTKIPIAVDQADSYVVAVRPVKGGQFVGSAKSRNVTSGGGGQPPNVKALPVIPVKLQPHAQQVQYVSSYAGDNAVKILQQSTGDTFDLVNVGNTNPPRYSKGQMLRGLYLGSPVIYRVTAHQMGSPDYQYLQLAAVNSNAKTLPVTTIFGSASDVYFDGLSGVTTDLQTVRFIASIPVPNEIRLVGLSFGSEHTNGDETTPAVIRVYQISAPSLATSIEVSSFGSDQPLYNDASLEILRSRGDLTLVIDAYSSSVAASNMKALVGKLTILYRDIETKPSTRIREVL